MPKQVSTWLFYIPVIVDIVSCGFLGQCAIRLLQCLCRCWIHPPASCMATSGNLLTADSRCRGGGRGSLPGPRPLPRRRYLYRRPGSGVPCIRLCDAASHSKQCMSLWSLLPRLVTPSAGPRSGRCRRSGQPHLDDGSRPDQVGVNRTNCVDAGVVDP